MKQKKDRYEMHKYWGKKPSKDLNALVNEYTEVGDTVLDPFSGYGVFCCEALIMERNVVANDLNPIAHFLNHQLLNREIDLDLMKNQWLKIRKEFEPFNSTWFSWEHDGKNVQFVSVLRDEKDIPVKAKIKRTGKDKAKEIMLDPNQVEEFLLKENSFVISDWYPIVPLITNSRISAKPGMTVAGLFTKRTLACHARLLTLINKYSSGNELELFKVAFTSNLANCSKLVPPIASRGDMSQGAWMTGFYTGLSYIENNVLHYFENRLEKCFKGKLDYLNQIVTKDKLDFPRTNVTYKVMRNDAKHLDLESESVDYVFTDPPYGDAVPYFEQSIIWNSWLQFNTDYENEIVVSDSKVRGKDINLYERDINLAFMEIRRVLKTGKFFSLTYHSLSGLEWKAITNACIRNGFEMHNFKWLVQKSFTPRQLNRAKSIKGDVLVTFTKSVTNSVHETLPDEEIRNRFIRSVSEWLTERPLDTNEVFLRIMRKVFLEKLIIGNVDLLDVLTENFTFTKDQKWILND